MIDKISTESLQRDIEHNDTFGKLEELPMINGIQVTHTFRGNDLIVVGNYGELRNVLFVNGASTTIHRTQLLPIRIK